MGAYGIQNEQMFGTNNLPRWAVDFVEHLDEDIEIDHQVTAREALSTLQSVVDL